MSVRLSLGVYEGQIRSVCHQLSNQPWVSAHSHPRVPTPHREQDIAVAVKPPKSFLSQPSRRCPHYIWHKIFFSLENVSFKKKQKNCIFILYLNCSKTCFCIKKGLTYIFLCSSSLNRINMYLGANISDHVLCQWVHFDLLFYFMQGYQTKARALKCFDINSFLMLTNGGVMEALDWKLFYSANPRIVPGLASSLTPNVPTSPGHWNIHNALSVTDDALRHRFLSMFQHADLPVCISTCVHSSGGTCVCPHVCPDSMLSWGCSLRLI